MERSNRQSPLLHAKKPENPSNIDSKQTKVQNSHPLKFIQLQNRKRLLRHLQNSHPLLVPNTPSLIHRPNHKEHLPILEGPRCTSKQPLPTQRQLLDTHQNPDRLREDSCLNQQRSTGRLNYVPESVVAEVEDGTHQHNVEELGVTIVFKLEIDELLSEDGGPVALRRDLGPSGGVLLKERICCSGNERTLPISPSRHILESRENSGGGRQSCDSPLLQLVASFEEILQCAQSSYREVALQSHNPLLHSFVAVSLFWEGGKGYYVERGRDPKSCWFAWRHTW
jgi:hypothetical protein